MKKQALIVANLAGFASFLLDQIRILQEAGYEVTYAANGNLLAWEDTRGKLDELAVPFRQIDFNSTSPLAAENRRAYRQLKALLGETRYDLIHCHTPIAGLLTRLAARSQRRHGTRVIYTTHGFAFTSRSTGRQRLIYRTLESFGSRFCDAIITINREDYAAAAGMHCKKVFYTNGVGVDTEKYRSAQVDRDAYRTSIGVRPDQVMVLSVGELSERKNHRVVIEALSLLPDKERYVYVICGNGIHGGTGQALQALADRLSVHLILLGFRTDIPEIMAVSDIGALPSLREGLGLSGVQSLAAGVPVAGTDVQGIRDYVKDGETGYLCAPEPQAFSDAIARLTGAREQMADACRRMAEQFDRSVAHAQMERIYGELLLSD